MNSFDSFKSLKSKNVFADIFLSIKKRPILDNELPFYFYRYIGIKNNKISYKKSIESFINKLEFMKIQKLIFINKIKIPTLSDNLKTLDNSISSSFDSNIDYTKKIILEFSQTNFSNIDLNPALEILFDLYLKIPANNNITKFKNFILKILSWFESYCIFDYSNPIDTPPKVIYLGDLKSHEAYFLVFLYLMKFDIIYINTKIDSEFEFFKFFSNIEEFGLKDDIDFSDFKKKTDEDYLNKAQPNKNDKQKNPTKINTKTSNILLHNSLDYHNDHDFNLNTDIKIINSLKSSQNPFEEILVPLNSRGEFIVSNTCIISNYFTRVLGCDDNLEKYSNKIYELHDNLKSIQNYIKFENFIPIKSNSSNLKEFSKFFDSIKSIDNHTLQSFINSIDSHDLFKNKLDIKIYNSVLIGLYNIISLYLSIENNKSLQSFKNFALKILFWALDILPNLFSNISYNTNTRFNPKVLYFGNIKKHESYFLLFLSSLSVDIIYINPQKNDLNLIPTDILNSLSHSIEYPNTSEFDFPSKQILTSEETIAFKASQEIESLIHGEETGIYKPWQFENSSFKPLRLNTTYDELKILWNEEARVRSGFSLNKNIITIPCIFSKISGTQRDLDEYLKDYRYFKSANNAIFYNTIPFFHKTYSDGNTYILNSIFDKNGFIDFEKFKSHNLYRYSHLKTSLQKNICEKLNLLFSSKILSLEMTTDLKLRISLTIMNLNDDILNILQNHDYPFAVPKIIIYDNTSAMFELEDSILISFLYLMAFDVLILTPSGYNNIESHLNNNFIQTHKLEELRFNLNIEQEKNKKSKGFLSNFFG